MSEVGRTVISHRQTKQWEQTHTGSAPALLSGTVKYLAMDPTETEQLEAQAILKSTFLWNAQLVYP